MKDTLHETGPRRYHSRVLVAEDNAVHRSLVRNLLEQMGCEVDAVDDGRQALEKFTSEDYGLVFMDWQMPVLDGVAATQKMRDLEARAPRLNSPVPIIALTAHSLPGDRNRCLEAGMDDYLCKPVSRRTLDGVLAKWTKRAVDSGESTTQESSAAEDEVILDASQIEELAEIERDGAPGLVSHLIDTYLADAPSKLSLLQTAARENDPLGVQVSTHSFKSASSTVGGHRLYRLCHELERDARAKTLDRLDERVAAILAEFELVKAELEKLKRRFAATTESD